MDNQQQRIAGYRELTQSEIDMMNEIKALEARWNGLLDRLRVLPDIDQRQAAIAATEGESAFMRAVRSVARPVRQLA
jgi:hypothetical protein